MSYDDDVAKICRLTNGWAVEIYDPPAAEVKAEEKAAKKGDSPMATSGIYKSPWKTLAFSTFDEVIKFLAEKVPMLKPRNFDEEYSKAFNDTIESMKKPPEKKK